MSQPRTRSQGSTHRIDGIVLAAGRSRRMGEPKPLLAVDGDATFIERVVHALAAGGCGDVVVVAGPDDHRIVELAEAAGATCAVNPERDSEQIDSLRVGLAALRDGAEGVVLLPVDHPLVRADSVAAVIDAFRARRAPIVRAAHEREPGHPTLIARTLFEELARDPLPRGAETVIERHAAEIEDVDVDDPGVLADIDTPEDYRRHVRAR